MKYYILKCPEMMLFFNALSRLNILKKKIKIQIPLMNNMTVFSIQQRDERVNINQFVSIDEYAKHYYPISKRLKEKDQKEIPDYQALKSTLFQSGILVPSGQDKLLSLLADIRKQDILHGGDVYYIACDTNVLRDRFFSTCLSKMPYHQNIDFILCETVRDELKNRQDKLKKQKLKDIRTLNYDQLEECFLNQNTLEDRMRYVGFMEYNVIRSQTSCEEIEAPSKKNGMQNDREIINAYSDFVDVGKKIIFISRDNEIVRMMTGESNVIPIILEHKPSRRKNFSVTWDQFFDLLYMMGILFGKLRLVKEKHQIADIYGVWKGKDVEEWESGYVKLCLHATEHHTEITHTMGRNMSILKQLNINM